VESSELQALIQAMQQQTEALNRMANSIAALANAVAEMVDDGEENRDVRTYMDGSPL
jgi:hypothetical protein